MMRPHAPLAALGLALILLPGLLAGCEDTGNPVLVPNVPPSISLLLPEPDPGGDPIPMEADQGLEFRAQVHDDEDEADQMVIDWSAVRTDLGDTSTPVVLGETVPDSSGLSDYIVAGLEAGQWLVVARVTDTDDASDDASLAILVIAVNTAPEVEIIAPTPGSVWVEDDVVTFSGAVADDRGTDQLTVEWYSNLDGVLNTDAPSSAGLLTFSDDTLTVGNHTVTVTVTDGGDLQGADSVTFEVESGNLPPTTPSVDLIPDEPNTNDDLACTVTVASTDPEGLPVTTTFSWFKNGSPTAWADGSLTADQTAAGETWTCEVVGNDGVHESEPASDTVTISNTEPSVDSVTLSPAPAYEDTVLTCAGVGWDDPDGDAEDYIVAWDVSGTPLAATATTLDGADFDAGDVVSCTLTPWDGTIEGLPVASNQVLIENSAPTSPVVTLAPAPAAALGDDLVCQASGSVDVDPADSVTYDVQWLLDGGHQPAWDGVWILPASETSLGNLWACEATATDGLLASLPASASTEVLPMAGDLVITEYMVRPDAVPDASGEWVEVYNGSGATISLLGFELHDDGTDSHVITADLVLPAATYAVLARNGDYGSNGGVIAAYEYTGFTLENTIDQLVISFGVVEVDRVEYDWSGELLGHAASLDPALGTPSDIDNDPQANWCGSSVPLVAPGSDFGTPGGANDSCACFDSDGDLDGYGDDAACPFYDCDDANPGINAEAYDVCENGVDEDCSGGDALCDCLSTDSDGDGYGTGAACSPVDCNDSDGTINPGATEICDFIDNDCDSAVDEGFDGDGDGWTVCEGDCNDTSGSVHPTASESCNGTDDDCDGTIDEGFDSDLDGWTTCEGDCNDSNGSIHPGATDTCNGVNDDCDGSTDEDASGDAYEPNNSSSQAPTINTDDSSATIWATIHYSSDSSDWYAISTSDDFEIGCDSFHVNASLTSIPSGADYDLYLYNSGLGLLDSSINYNAANESVSWSVSCFSGGDDGGLFYVRVARWSGWSCSDTYQLSVSNGG
jgi:hypothetical protein